jgi:hypothetical protein
MEFAAIKTKSACAPLTENQEFGNPRKRVRVYVAAVLTAKLTLS